MGRQPHRVARGDTAPGCGEWGQNCALTLDLPKQKVDKGKDVPSSTLDLGCEAGLQWPGTRPEAPRQAEVRVPARLVLRWGLLKLPRLQSGLGSRRPWPLQMGLDRKVGPVQGQ